MTSPITLAELQPAQFRPAIGQLVAVYAAAMRPPPRMLSGRDSILDRHSASPGFRALVALVPGAPGDGAPGDSAPHDGAPHDSAPGNGAPGDGPPGGARPADGLGGQVVAGFAYGFHGQRGQWWHDTVATALATTYPPSATTWLADCIEVAELHVAPAYQGQGIGRRLLTTLTGGRPERTAVLSTQDADTPARHLYRSVGFTDLLSGFLFSGMEPPYAVMGAPLPLRPR
ncbi:MAG TPA: GNAT family N-acetyltransferase [Trebonia sp.]|nr:GNAT family N-acetyltransferase [Trebonia sp.]